MASAKKTKRKQSKSTDPDEVTLREITKDDTEFLFGVYASTRAEEMAMTQWDEAEKVKFLRSQFDAQQKHFRFFYPKANYDIILFKNQPAGYMYVDRGPKSLLGVDIALLPQYRNTGIGSLLINNLLDEADKKGVPFNIQVLKYNTAALRLYERLGFSYTGEEGMHVKMKWNKE